MLDDVFTSGGLLSGLAALGLWIRLAIRMLPSFETLLARYEDDPGPVPRRPDPASRLAVSATAVALAFCAIGYALPG